MIIINAPDRFIVVDGNVYWLAAPTQPGGNVTPLRPAAARLLSAPITATGRVSWDDSWYVHGIEPAQVDAIIAALSETFAGLDAARQMA